MIQATATANGEPFTYLTTEEAESGDIEAVPSELKGREAIRIEDLHKTFKTCFKPGVKAVNGMLKICCVFLGVGEGHLQPTNWFLLIQVSI